MFVVAYISLSGMSECWRERSTRWNFTHIAEREREIAREAMTNEFNKWKQNGQKLKRNLHIRENNRFWLLWRCSRAIDIINTICANNEKLKKKHGNILWNYNSLSKQNKSKEIQQKSPHNSRTKILLFCLHVLVVAVVRYEWTCIHVAVWAYTTHTQQICWKFVARCCLPLNSSFRHDLVIMRAR